MRLRLGKGKRGAHASHRRLIAVSLIAVNVVVSGVAGVVFAAPAHAGTDVKLTLTINRVHQFENPDSDGGDGDYFPEIRIGDGPLERRPAVQDDVFDPSKFDPPWVFSQTTNVPDDRTTIPVLIRLWDEDGGTSGGDDKLDISPQNQDVDLELNYDIGTDTWTAPGDLLAPGQTLIDGDGDPNFPNANDGKKAGIGIDIKREGKLPDIDGDGIFDVIERFGVRNKDGSMVHDLKAMGANPCRKTIIVQIDYMTGAADGHSHKPKDAAIREVGDAFEDAPVDPAPTCPYPGFPTPQGVDFVHVEGRAIAEQAVMGLNTAAYRNARAANFNAALRPFAHYAIFAHDQAAGSSSSGQCCENTQPDKDFIVTLGSWRTRCVAPGPNDTLDSTKAGDDVVVGSNIDVGPNRTCDTAKTGDDQQILNVGTGADDAGVGTVRDQSGSILHELGHALGLAHGGNDRTNNKPNYLSVMNYSFDPTGIPTSADRDAVRRLDYSRSELPTLDRTQLVEQDGIKDGADFTRWTDPTGAQRFGPGTGPLNWDWDFRPDGTPIIDPPTVNVDINTDDDVCVLPGTDGMLTTTKSGDDQVVGNVILDGSDGMCQTTPATGDTGRATQLTGFDDWKNLKYRAVGAAGADTPVEPSGPEIDFQEALGREIAFHDFYDPDLATTKTVDKATALPGDSLTYQVKVDNVGKGDATAVKLTDTLPDGTAATRALPNLEAGKSRTETFTYTVPCTTADGASLTNRAIATATNYGGGAEANTTNNTGTASSTIKAPKLTVAATATPTANAAEAVTTTLTPANTGSATATNVTLTYVLPAGVYYSAALDQGQGPRPTSVTRNADGTTTVSWQLGAIDSGADKPVRFTTRSSLLTVGGTDLTGQAKATYGNANGCTYEPVTASATTTVTEAAPTRNPQTSTIWTTFPGMRTAELLARVQATDTRFDGADGTTPNGLLTQQEASAALRLPLLQPRTLQAELLATYLNLADRRINAATRVQTITIERLGLRTVGDAARYAQATLALSPGSNLIRYTDTTLALIEINSGLAERY